VVTNVKVNLKVNTFHGGQSECKKTVTNYVRKNFFSGFLFTLYDDRPVFWNGFVSIEVLLAGSSSRSKGDRFMIGCQLGRSD